MRQRETLESLLQRQYGKFVSQRECLIALIHPPDRRAILNFTVNLFARFSCSYREVKA